MNRSAHPDRKSTRLNSSHSLHDALPILVCPTNLAKPSAGKPSASRVAATFISGPFTKTYEPFCSSRSEEHTSELQSLPTRRSSDLGVPDKLGEALRREAVRFEGSGDLHLRTLHQDV